MDFENAIMTDFPPTIIVTHPKERRSKCTVAPLRGSESFVFWKFPSRGTEPLDNYVRLGFDGPILSSQDANRGLLVLDGTWRWSLAMEKDFAQLPVRSLPSWKTAYPRVSITFEYPPGCLATIEAIYVAYKLLERETDSLLDDYHWADVFLRLNDEMN